MMQFMEEHGQYYHQTEKEATEFVQVYVHLQKVSGPVCLLTYNDDSIAPLMTPVSEVQHAYEGKVVTEMLILN